MLLALGRKCVAFQRVQYVLLSILACLNMVLLLRGGYIALDPRRRPAEGRETSWLIGGRNSEINIVRLQKGGGHLIQVSSGAWA